MFVYDRPPRMRSTCAWVSTADPPAVPDVAAVNVNGRITGCGGELNTPAAPAWMCALVAAVVRPENVQLAVTWRETSSTVTSHDPVPALPVAGFSCAPLICEWRLWILATAERDANNPAAASATATTFDFIGNLPRTFATVVGAAASRVINRHARSQRRL